MSAQTETYCPYAEPPRTRLMAMLNASVATIPAALPTMFITVFLATRWGTF